MKIRILILFAIITNLSLQGQTFYDMNKVQKIEITFAQSNWDALLDAEKAGADGYIMAQSVAINGVVFDSVGVKYKGNSTYNANNAKNPFHIELDTYKDHIYEAYTDIKLSNAYNDPSFVREVLSYQILRQYMDAPLSNYANVYVNGVLIGLYSSSEAVSRKFLSSRFASKNNTFVKCNPPAGAGPGTSDYPNLTYISQDSADYYDAYEMKSDLGWQELINLCDTLSNEIGAIEQILDVDRALWMLAFNNVFVNLDSYSGAFSQNYYLYKDNYGKFLPVVWDLNESFGRFSMTGTINLSNTAQKQQMTHLLHMNDAGFPLIKQLLNVPMYKRMYLAHMKTMLQENFSNNTYYATAQTLQSVADSSVQVDVNKFYTYSNFTTNLTTDVTSGAGPQTSSAPGITNLMNARSSYLLAQSDFTATEPDISNVTISSQAPLLGESITITATLLNETNVYFGFRKIENAHFTRVLMYDDGAHNDGAANDGVYGINLTINSPSIQYYIYAENSNIGRFSPQRAEHEFYSITAVSELVINEFMADNENTIYDQNASFEDWIEIFNNTNDSIYLGDYFLTDDVTDPTQWRLPSEYIAGGGFKLIWASGDTTIGDNHANFKLSKSGEEIGLFHDNGISLDTTDYISFSVQSTDVSYGRSYDASPDWVFFSPSTPNASNGTVGINEIEKSGLKIYPNPYHSNLIIDNPTGNIAKVTIYSLMGQVLQELQINSYETYQWNDDSAKGFRIITIDTKDSREVFRVISQ